MAGRSEKDDETRRGGNKRGKKSVFIPDIPMDRYEGRMHDLNGVPRGPITVSARKLRSDLMARGPSGLGEGSRAQPEASINEPNVMMPDLQYIPGVLDETRDWYNRGGSCSSQSQYGSMSEIPGDVAVDADDEDEGEGDRYFHSRSEEPMRDVRPTHGRVRYPLDDSTWLLSSGIDGGPQDPSVLSSFRGHIAYHIWNGEERGVLTGHSRFDGLKKWMPNRRDSKELISNSGLEHLRYCIYDHINMPLICAFVERWQPETNSFHMPFGEMTITLHDVHYLLGVPVSGNAVIPETKVVDLQGALATLLGIPFGDVKRAWKSGCIKSYILSENLSLESVGADNYARGYLLWLLGSTLFVDKSRVNIPASFLPCLDDLQSVCNYSWGAAALAYLYRQLGMASRKECTAICGCLTLLQAWIYEHFPTFRPKECEDWQSSLPYACRWEPVKVRQDIGTVKLHRATMDKMTARDVVFMPYGLESVEAVPVSKFHGIIHCRSITEPYMPDRVARQFGYTQFVPAVEMKPLRVRRPTNVMQYMCDFQSNVTLWHNWVHHLINMGEKSTRCVTGSDVSPEYLSWYIKISHRHIRPVERISDQLEYTDSMADLHKRMEHLAMLTYPLHDSRIASTPPSIVKRNISMISSHLEDYHAFIEANKGRGRGSRSGAGRS